MTTPLGWTGAWRLARRGLDWRFSGLRLLIVCLVIGSAALAAIGTLTGTINHELAARGRSLLGGDVEFEVVAQEATPRARAALAALGTLSTGARLSAMVTRAGDSGNAVPIALKSVDARWPLYGRLTLTDGRHVGAPAGTTAWIDQGLADRLGTGTGQRIVIGATTFTIGGVIGDEPDRLGEGFALGPTVIVNTTALRSADLIQPGAMIRWKYRLRLAPGLDPTDTVKAITTRFPDAGFQARTRDKASPGLDRFVSRMGQFLELVALAALLIAGIGIGNGVSSYLTARRDSIATLKVLGATSGAVAQIFALQLLVASGVAIALGLALGLALTPLCGAALAGLLPVSAGLVVDPLALLRAGSYGVLIALAFAAPPLLAARSVPPAGLFRAEVAPPAGRWRQAALPALLGIGGIGTLAIAGAAQPWLAAGFLAAAVACFLLLAGLGTGLTWVAARLPRPRAPLLRLALANLHRPGASTTALVVALGFALSAFVMLASVETSLNTAIASQVPARAPDYFVLDVPSNGLARFTDLVARAAPGATIRSVPALRGTITAFGPPERMIRVADIIHIPEDAWSLRGDRGLTYAEAVPDGNVITAGRWWPRDYHGAPLVSVDEGQARAIGLQLGDQVTISLLGVERSARVASLRRVNWDSFGFNYVLVFSPNALADAPHTLAATIALPPGQRSPQARRALLAGLVHALPSSSVIEVGPILGQARALLDQVSTAILAAAGVAVLAGLAVLAGAIAAARERRLYDAVVLRVLGASSRQLLGLVLAEYALLATLLGGVALVMGSVAAWAIMAGLLEFPWAPDWLRVAAVLGGGMTVVVATGIIGSIGVLRTRPAQALRAL